LFDEAFKALDLLSDVSTGLDRALGVDESGEVPVGARPQRLGFTAGQFQTIGVATMMRRLLDAFQQSIVGWLRAVRTGPAGAELTDEQRRRLFVMCRSFEITTEVMPLSELESQADFGGAAEPLSTIEQRDRAVRRAGAEDVFTRLASEVRAAAVRAVTAGSADQPDQPDQDLG
jgi:hypothetical protein